MALDISRKVTTIRDVVCAYGALPGGAPDAPDRITAVEDLYDAVTGLPR